ncbi:MAG: 4'-phosphopantetheinyl transferase superfamily protein [Gammaproteobacteria bacterium]|nr:4'-phosphopantetheinyl transferase superfamily protein [Gammaproteobacteria bacterium]MCW8987363.1 4'-phosphopantetheinyl transferase superfamily protein [Gammaproteobacteria bacterium]
MSVSILYYKVTPERISSAQLSEQIAAWIADGLEELPPGKQLRINKLHQQNDRVLSLAGLRLLKIAMAEFSNVPFSLSQVQFPEQAKPFIQSHIDFNISHSGDIVCCIVSDSTKVGIDIEVQRDVKAATINKYLTETTHLFKARNPEKNKQEFFTLWTKYEAIIKAANHGSIFNMHDIQLENNGGHYQNQFWYTYPVDIVSGEDNKEYTCHIACSEDITPEKINLRQIHEL